MGPISHIGLISPISLGSVDYKKWGNLTQLQIVMGFLCQKKERTPQMPSGTPSECGAMERIWESLPPNTQKNSEKEMNVRHTKNHLRSLLA